MLSPIALVATFLFVMVRRRNRAPVTPTWAQSAIWHRALGDLQTGASLGSAERPGARPERSRRAALST